MDDEKRRKIIAIFEEFLKRSMQRISKLTLDDFDFNPFLLRILARGMGFNGARDIVSWMVQQRLERGMVTSFGTTLEKVALVFGETTGAEGADMMLTRGGRHYYFQVKSGPNTVPKDLADRTSELLQSVQRRNRGSVALFGMCYGNPDRVSSIVRTHIKVDYYVGRDFWAFISGDDHCIEEIFSIAAEVGDSYRDSSGKTFHELIQEKIEQLTREFRQIYGDGPEMWRKILEKNS